MTAEQPRSSDAYNVAPGREATPCARCGKPPETLNPCSFCKP